MIRVASGALEVFVAELHVIVGEAFVGGRLVRSIDVFVGHVSRNHVSVQSEFRDGVIRIAEYGYVNGSRQVVGDVDGVGGAGDGGHLVVVGDRLGFGADVDVRIPARRLEDQVQRTAARQLIGSILATLNLGAEGLDQIGVGRQMLFAQDPLAVGRGEIKTEGDQRADDHEYKFEEPHFDFPAKLVQRLIKLINSLTTSLFQF